MRNLPVGGRTFRQTHDFNYTALNASFQLLDWIVLITYFVATLGIGFFFYRKTRNTEGFTAGNRSIPGWVCGLSIFATFLSSISYLANAGKTFVSDWNAFVFSLSVPLATWVAVKYFLPYYRQSKHVSAYAALEDRFGLWARMYASFFYMLTQLARMAVVMYLVALPMQVIFGWNIYICLIVIGVSVTLYSFVGGVVAVIWTDAIQAVVLIGGAVIVLVVMLLQMPGGVGQIFEVASNHDKFSLGSFSFEMAEKTFWTLILFGIAENLRNFGIDQSYIQRYIASKSDREAKQGLWLAGLLYVPMSALFFFIGTTLFAFYQADKVVGVETTSAVWQSSELEDLNAIRGVVARQELLQRGISEEDPGFTTKQDEIASDKGLADLGDRVFPYFIATRLPAGVTGLLIAAVFAAGMSTISTSLNSSATLTMTDYYKRLINKDASEKQQMGALYFGTVFWGTLGTLLAIGLVQVTQSALDMWWTLSGIFSGGMVGLFILGLISRKAKNPAAISAVIAGVLVILWMSLPKVADMLLNAPVGSMLHGIGSTLSNLSSGGLSSPFNALLIPVIGTLTILVVGILVSRFIGSQANTNSTHEA
jgi:solute:Na+ symporter, SSS family